MDVSAALDALSSVLHGVLLRLGMRISIADRAKERLIASLEAQLSGLKGENEALLAEQRDTSQLDELEEKLEESERRAVLQKVEHAEEKVKLEAANEQLKLRNAELTNALAQQERLNGHLQEQLAAAEAYASSLKEAALSPPRAPHVAVPKVAAAAAAAAAAEEREMKEVDASSLDSAARMQMISQTLTNSSTSSRSDASGAEPPLPTPLLEQGFEEVTCERV